MPIVVNGTTITETELAGLRENLSSEVQDDKKIGLDNLDFAAKMLIDRVLIQQEALKKIGQLPPGAVRRKMKSLIQRLGGEEGFKAYLSTNGVTREELEHDLEIGLKVDTLLNEICGGISEPTQEEAKAHYEEHAEEFKYPEFVSLAQIIKRTGNALERATVARTMESVHKALSNGASFTEMVRAHSDIKEHDGYMGTGPTHEMPEEIRVVLEKLGEDEISGIIDMGAALMILKLMKRHPPKIMKFEEAHDDVLNTLRLESENAAIDDYAAELIKKANIEFS